MFIYLFFLLLNHCAHQMLPSFLYFLYQWHVWFSSEQKVLRVCAAIFHCSHHYLYLNKGQWNKFLSRPIFVLDLRLGLSCYETFHVMRKFLISTYMYFFSRSVLVTYFIELKQFIIHSLETTGSQYYSLVTLVATCRYATRGTSFWSNKVILSDERTDIIE